MRKLFVRVCCHVELLFFVLIIIIVFLNWFDNLGGLALGMALICYGQEEAADTIIATLLRDKVFFCFFIMIYVSFLLGSFY